MARRQLRFGKWSVGRAAALFRRGATRQQVLDYFLEKYGSQFRISTRQEMERYLFGRPTGLKPGFQNLFEGKEPEQVKLAYAVWLAKTGGVRARMSQSATGKSVSAETRRKIGAGKKGKPLSAETRRKIGESNKGKLRSEETKRRWSLARKGKKKSAETRAKMGAWQRGRKLPQSTIDKISATLTGKTLSDATRAKIAAAGRKRRQSAATRRKISEANRRYWEKIYSGLIREFGNRGLHRDVDSRKRTGEKFDLSTTRADPAGYVLEKERIELTKRAISQLENPLIRRVLSERILEENSVANIAHSIGLSEEETQQLLSKGLVQLASNRQLMKYLTV
ncbi:MAG: NUMOD3 domain-containing DNA-binding protein [Candidatus Micrarchaeota archaeon]